MPFQHGFLTEDGGLLVTGNHRSKAGEKICL